jgi:CRISPR/Cas system CMR-associated protein Cmr3 (group 5 of RAMP superfamily)
MYKVLSKEEILEKLEAIGVAIEDSYNTAVDTSENSDSMYYIDLARNLVEKLMVSVEGEKVTLDEVMNTSPALAKLL